jgi:hypothetical protein
MKISIKKIMDYTKIILLFLLILSEFTTCYSKIKRVKTFKKLTKNHASHLKTHHQTSTNPKGDDEEGDFNEDSYEPAAPNTITTFISQYKFFPNDNPNNQILDREVAIDLNQDDNCNIGFGFPGTIRKEVKSQLNSIPGLSSLRNFSFFNPFLTSLAEYFEFDVAYGDFSGEEILKNDGVLSIFPCNSIEINKEDKFGLIAYKGENLKCGTRTNSHLNMCLIFDRCGTVSLSIDGDSLDCVASMSNYGLALKKASSYVISSSFGVAITRKFPKQVKIGKILNSDFEDHIYHHSGNFFFSVNGRMPPLKYMIGDTSMDKVIQIYGDHISLSIGAGQDNAERIMIDLNQGNIGEAEESIFNRMVNLGVEFVITTKGKLSLYLSDITHGVFPDLLLDVKS